MRVPYLDDDSIFHKANDFLCQHHPSFECPILIEIIIGKELGIFVFPTKDLEKCCDVHGGISKDFKSILIDEKQYMNQEGRSRFTIAHELGHIILHSHLFSEISQLNTDQDYIDFQNHIIGSIIDMAQKKFGVTRDCAYNKFRRDYSELFNRVFTNSPF